MVRYGLVKVRFRVSAEEASRTIGSALRGRVEGLTWERARRLTARGKVTVDGAPATDAAARLRAGQEVVLDERAPTPEPADAARIAFEDAHVIVIDKRSGVSSVPYEKRERGTAMDAIRAAWKHAGRRASESPLLVVHRIDKETSGLLAFAKTKLAERALQARFRAHDVERTYLCVVHGALSDRRIETRLVEDRGDGLRGSARRLGQGKRAVTHVRALEPLGAATLCEVRLETGQTHQIRIHLAEGGHPIVGERVYIRDYLRKRPDEEPIASPRLLLHAATLGFAHPVTGHVVQLSAPLPDDFQRVLARLRGAARRRS
jgi:23S rRNA pseudouridine1911/1915/1917 synthase